MAELAGDIIIGRGRQARALVKKTGQIYTLACRLLVAEPLIPPEGYIVDIRPPPGVTFIPPEGAQKGVSGRGGGRWSVRIATNASIIVPAEGAILDPLRKLKGIYLMSALIIKITSAFLLLFIIG